MIIETSELLTIKHYADLKGVTTTAVYSWISKGIVDCIEIDSVKFVKIKSDEEK